MNRRLNCLVTELCQKHLFLTHAEPGSNVTISQHPEAKTPSVSGRFLTEPPVEGRHRDTQLLRGLPDAESLHCGELPLG